MGRTGGLTTAEERAAAAKPRQAAKTARPGGGAAGAPKAKKQKKTPEPVAVAEENPKLVLHPFTAEDADPDERFLYSAKGQKPFLVHKSCVTWEFGQPTDAKGLIKPAPEPPYLTIPTGPLPENAEAGSQFTGALQKKHIKNFDAPKTDNKPESDGYWRDFQLGGETLTFKPDGYDHEINLPQRLYMALVSAGKAIDGNLAMFLRLLSLCSPGDWFYDEYNRKRKVSIIEPSDDDVDLSPYLFEGTLRITATDYITYFYSRIGMVAPYEVSFIDGDGRIFTPSAVDGEEPCEVAMDDDETAKKLAPQPFFICCVSTMGQSDSPLGDDITSSYDEVKSALQKMKLNALSPQTIAWIQSDIRGKGLEAVCPGLMNLHSVRCDVETLSGGLLAREKYNGTPLDMSLKWDDIVQEAKLSSQQYCREEETSWSAKAWSDELFAANIHNEPATMIYPYFTVAPYTTKGGQMQKKYTLATRFDKSKSLMILSMPNKKSDWFTRVSAYTCAISSGTPISDDIIKSNPFASTGQALTCNDASVSKMRAELDAANCQIIELKKRAAEDSLMVSTLSQETKALKAKVTHTPQHGDFVVVQSALKLAVREGIESVSICNQMPDGSDLKVKLDGNREFTLNVNFKLKNRTDYSEDEELQQLLSTPCVQRIGYNGA
jgi:hypothetical protein